MRKLPDALHVYQDHAELDSKRHSSGMNTLILHLKDSEIKTALMYWLSQIRNLNFNNRFLNCLFLGWRALEIIILKIVKNTSRLTNSQFSSKHTHIYEENTGLKYFTITNIFIGHGDIYIYFHCVLCISPPEKTVCENAIPNHCHLCVWI